MAAMTPSPAAEPASDLGISRVGYDRARMVHTALMAALLGAFIVAVYLIIVVGIGGLTGISLPNTGLSILATVVVVVLLQRAKDASRRFANRRVYGERATPYEVLSSLSQHVALTTAPEDLLPAVARLVAEGTGALHATVWIRIGDHLAPAATWPSEARMPTTRIFVGDGAVGAAGAWPGTTQTNRAVNIAEGGEHLGAISVDKAEPLTANEDRLLEDIASQAAVVLRNVRLSTELSLKIEEVSTLAAQLRASRRRIVAAQDAERRKLERDIHDGAQQHLVALAVKARLTRSAIDKNPDQDSAKARSAIAEVRLLGEESLRTLQDLSQGIYPPVLAEEGFPAAVRVHMTATGIDATLKVEGSFRYEPGVEEAAYFAVLEALNNARRHAGGAAIAVRVIGTKELLSFEVTDDGPGFDPERREEGTGLAGMTDRIAAAGGRLTLTSKSGGPTTVRASIPAPSQTEATRT